MKILSQNQNSFQKLLAGFYEMLLTSFAFTNFNLHFMDFSPNSQETSIYLKVMHHIGHVTKFLLIFSQQLTPALKNTNL